jgi:hypothetical protein
MRSRHLTVGRLRTKVAGARNAELNPQSVDSSHSHALESPPAPSPGLLPRGGSGSGGGSTAVQMPQLSGHIAA